MNNILKFKFLLKQTSPDQINNFGHYISYLNDCYNKAYNFIRSKLYLNIILKDDYKDDFETCNNLSYQVGDLYYRCESIIKQIEDLKTFPSDYLKDKVFDLNEVKKLITVTFGVKSYFSNLDFLKKTLWSKFCIVRKYVFDDYTYGQYVNFELNDNLIDELIGVKQFGQYIYIDVINKLISQLQDAVELTEQGGFYGKTSKYE